MDGEWLWTGTKFKGGDKVLIASKEACTKIHPISALHSDQGTAPFFDLIGTVESVMPTGDVKVTFGEDIQCITEPEALVKMRKFLPADLVQVVDDIRDDGNQELLSGDYYNEISKIRGRIGIVLSNCKDLANEVDVAIAGEHRTFNRIHLDFVARLSYGDITARVREYACKIQSSEEDSDDLVKNLFAALQKSIDDLPYIHTLPSSTPAPFAPGNVVKVSSQVTEFLRSHMGLSENDPTTHFRTLQDYACIGDNGWKMGPFPAQQVASLLEPGRVADVNPEGDAIVTFNDGRAWCFQSRFLQSVCITYYAESAGAPTPIPMKVFDGMTPFVSRKLNVWLGIEIEAVPAACYAGYTDIVKGIPFMGKYLEYEDDNANRFIHYAAHGNQPDTLGVLLQNEININAINMRHNTALHVAVKKGFVGCVQELAKCHRTLDVNIQDDIGNTALHIAIATKNNEIVKELINNTDVDFEITNKYGLNVLHLAALKGNVEAATKILAERNDVIDHQEKDQGYAALHFAALRGHYSIVKVLTQEWCTVDLQNKHGETALVVAAREGHWCVVQLLLLSGANINNADRHGNTALHMSLMNLKKWPSKLVSMAANPALQMVQKTLLDSGYTTCASGLQLSCFLVLRGADTHCLNNDDVTPLDIALSLEVPAGELLELFQKGKWCADSGKCNNCFYVPADTCLKPCGDSLYCSCCAKDMKCCLHCGKDIVTIITTGRIRKTIQKYVVRRADEAISGPKEIRGFLKRCAEDKGQRFADCLVVILMSHGSGDLICGADGKPVILSQVYQLFNNANCPALKGKPKLFFIQACRGRKTNHATNDALDSLVSDAASPKTRPEWSDMFIAYATIPDYLAIRDTKNGSWFISTIFNVFIHHAATTDLEALMHRVAHGMMLRSTSSQKMQTPNISTYGWTKKLFFN